MEATDSRENLIRMVNQYKNLVFSLCLKLTGDYFAAEDITQETFISAYTHSNECDGVNEKAWICKIASNKCIDYRRAAARRMIPTSEEEMPDATDVKGDPQMAVTTSDVLERIREACDSLDEKYRTVAIRHFIDGKTAAEIAGECGVSLKTIQTRIYRARELLRTMIRREDLLS